MYKYLYIYFESFYGACKARNKSWLMPDLAYKNLKKKPLSSQVKGKKGILVKISFLVFSPIL